MRSLYARLFVAFFAVLTLSVVGSYQGYRRVSRPNMVQMIGGPQAALAHEASAALQRGGISEARKYIDQLDSATQMPHYLIDQNGIDLFSGVDRSAFLSVGARPQPWGDRLAFVTPTGDNRHTLVTIGPRRYTFTELVPYLALIFVGDAILFWLIVTDIVRPLRRVAGAVRRFGQGDFAARAPVNRQDEIGQLATVFNDMAGRIETLVTSERRLLQDVSHELRSPLTRLNLGIELSRTAVDREHAADQLQREARRLSNLVETLLEVARLEGDPGSAPLTPVELMPLLRDSLKSGEVQAERQRVQVILAGEIERPIVGNGELLRRAFDNIVSNAIRYSPAEGIVRITCRESDADLLIEVRDCGPGVAEQHLAHLGSPFYRTDESRNGSTGGVGLGLAIARRAVHLHGGTIQFTNAAPGLRVSIHLASTQRAAPTTANSVAHSAA